MDETVLCNASPASSIPEPHTPATAHCDPGGKLRAVPVNIVSTWPGVRLALRASISDAVPATYGAAKLVPISLAYVGAPGAILPSFDIEMIRSAITPSPPGAERLTRLPKFE